MPKGRPRQLIAMQANEGTEATRNMDDMAKNRVVTRLF
jgi:hypothetical protein